MGPSMVANASGGQHVDVRKHKKKWSQAYLQSEVPSKCREKAIQGLGVLRRKAVGCPQQIGGESNAVESLIVFVESIKDNIYQ